MDAATAAAAEPAVETWVAATDRLFDPYETVGVTREGGVVVVDGRLPTGAL